MMELLFRGVMLRTFYSAIRARNLCFPALVPVRRFLCESVPVPDAVHRRYFPLHRLFADKVANPASFFHSVFNMLPIVLCKE